MYIANPAMLELTESQTRTNGLAFCLFVCLDSFVASPFLCDYASTTLRNQLQVRASASVLRLPHFFPCVAMIRNFFTTVSLTVARTQR